MLIQDRFADLPKEVREGFLNGMLANCFSQGLYSYTGGGKARSTGYGIA
jgi:hypothetical protein